MGSNIEALIIDIHKDLAVVKADIAALKADMRTHIKRTDILETEVKYARRHVYMVQGAVALLSVIATIVSIYK